jgi:hypothetical protein
MAARSAAEGMGEKSEREGESLTRQLLTGEKCSPPQRRAFDLDQRRRRPPWRRTVRVVSHPPVAIGMFRRH